MVRPFYTSVLKSNTAQAFLWCAASSFYTELNTKTNVPICTYSEHFHATGQSMCVRKSIHSTTLKTQRKKTKKRHRFSHKMFLRNALFSGYGIKYISSVVLGSCINSVHIYRRGYGFWCIKIKFRS